MVGMGDVKVAERADFERTQKHVQKTCSKALELPANQANCSGFAKDVASRLGISVGTRGGGKANDIYNEVTEKKSPWIKIGEGAEGARHAPYYATRGYLVLAVWKNEEIDPNTHKPKAGHVAVVTDFRNVDRNTHAMTDRNISASWGMLDHAELSQDGGAIRQSFGGDKREKIMYVAHPIMKFK